MRLHTPLSILGITATLALILGATVIAAPVSPPSGGYTGGVFSYYFKRIIEGDGTIGTTSGGVCPVGQVIRGFSTGSSTYGLPICANPTATDGGASSLTGSLRGTVNYLPKYGTTNTGIVNSQIFDNGTNVGIGTALPGQKLDVSGGSIRTTNQLISTLATGTAPLTVSSTTRVANLNVATAGTADQLTTARTINGISFNGTANIDITRLTSKGITAASTGRTVPDTGIYTYNTNNASLGDTTPTSYWSTIGWGRGVAGSAELATNWTSSGNELWFRSLRDTTDNWWEWKKIFHTGNDGVGSTLDADLLDGQQGAYYAPLASPGLTGTPTAPTAAVGVNTIQLATTAFVNAEIANDAPTKAGVGATGTWPIAITGNAATATVLQTARTINGVSFNGTANIILPTVDTTGDQTISGNKTFNQDIIVGTTINIGRGGANEASNTRVGTNSLGANTTGIRNTSMGFEALRYNTTGGSNVAVGWSALYSNTGGQTNTAIGGESLRFNTLGTQNTGIGNGALYSNTTGGSNVAVGNDALYNNINGYYNTANGAGALNSNITGNYNTSMGWGAGGNLTSGNYNVAIGYNTTFSSSTGSNQLNIGNWIYGNSGNIGIGTGSNLTAKMTVQGKVKVIDGTQGAGKILTSDANGLASWQTPPAELPIGTVMAFNSATCPSGWAVADGTSGTPDLRGEFIRGWDGTGSGARGVDSGRVLGSSQTGSYTAIGGSSANAVESGPGAAYINHIWGSNSVPTYWENITALNGTNRYNPPFVADSYVVAGYAGQVRPRNVALLYCQKVAMAGAAVSDSTTWINVQGTLTGNVALATTGKVGVGTTTPTEKLEVTGSIKVVDGNQGTGKVMVSDATGKATWQEMPGDLPVGSIMPFNGASCPAGWAIANGTGGTPDLRGEFVRGLDSGRGVDTGRGLGTFQEGSIYFAFPDGTAGWNMTEVNRTSLTTMGWESIITNKNITYRGAASGVSGDGAYTLTNGHAGMARPRNVALLYCMKVSAAPPNLSNSVTWMNVDGTSSGRVVLATSGNVGIGTATPNADLDVFGGEGSYNAPNFGSGNLGAIHITNSTNNTRNAITFSSTVGSDAQAGIYVNQDNGAGTTMHLATTNSYATGPQARMTILPTGNVGIGTTNPGEKLSIEGNQSIRGTSPTIFMRDTDQRSSALHTNSNFFYILTAPIDSTAWATVANGAWPMVVNLTNNDVSFGGNIWAYAYYYASDINLKKNIKKLTSPLEKVKQLNGYSFNWKESGKADIGVIAQEVEKVFPELVTESKNANGETHKNVAYANLVAPIIEAIKELAGKFDVLQKTVEKQQSELDKLREENKALKDRLDAIEARLGK